MCLKTSPLLPYRKAQLPLKRSAKCILQDRRRLLCVPPSIFADVIRQLIFCQSMLDEVALFRDSDPKSSRKKWLLPPHATVASLAPALCHSIPNNQLVEIPWDDLFAQAVRSKARRAFLAPLHVILKSPLG